MWALGFWPSAASALVASILFLVGTPRYRHFVPSGNPLSRFSQVVVASIRKWKVVIPSDGDELYEVDGKENSNSGSRNILHTKGFKFLDRAAVITSKEYSTEIVEVNNPWRLCTVTQVEEVKCILRLLPIWLYAQYCIQWYLPKWPLYLWNKELQ